MFRNVLDAQGNLFLKPIFHKIDGVLCILFFAIHHVLNSESFYLNALVGVLLIVFVLYREGVLCINHKAHIWLRVGGDIRFIYTLVFTVPLIVLIGLIWRNGTFREEIFYDMLEYGIFLIVFLKLLKPFDYDLLLTKKGFYIKSKASNTLGLQRIAYDQVTAIVIQKEVMKIYCGETHYRVSLKNSKVAKAAVSYLKTVLYHNVLETSDVM